MKNLTVKQWTQGLTERVNTLGKTYENFGYAEAELSNNLPYDDPMTDDELRDFDRDRESAYGDIQSYLADMTEANTIVPKTVIARTANALREAVARMEQANPPGNGDDSGLMEEISFLSECYQELSTLMFTPDAGLMVLFDDNDLGDTLLRTTMSLATQVSSIIGNPVGELSDELDDLWNNDDGEFVSCGPGCMCGPDNESEEDFIESLRSMVQEIFPNADMQVVRLSDVFPTA